MSRLSEEEARIDGYIRGYIDALFHAMFFAKEQLLDEDLKRVISSSIPGKLNGKDRRMEFAAYLRTRIDTWRNEDDPTHREFAQRLLRAFGDEFADYVPPGS
jgi:hypothetical protein